MTAKQRALKKKHGTPENFSKAVMAAVGEISVAEAAIAIHEYEYEWNKAGMADIRRVSPHRKLWDPILPRWIKITIDMELDVKHYRSVVATMVSYFEERFHVKQLYFARYTDVTYSQVVISANTNANWKMIEKFYRWPGVVKSVKIEDRTSGSMAHAAGYTAVKCLPPFAKDFAEDNDFADVVHWMCNMRGMDYLREARFYSWRAWMLTHQMADASDENLKKLRAAMPGTGKAQNGAEASKSAPLRKRLKSVGAAVRKASASRRRRNVGSSPQ